MKTHRNLPEMVPAFEYATKPEEPTLGQKLEALYGEFSLDLARRKADDSLGDWIVAMLRGNKPQPPVWDALAKIDAGMSEEDYREELFRWVLRKAEMSLKEYNSWIDRYFGIIDPAWELAETLDRLVRLDHKAEGRSLRDTGFLSIDRIELCFSLIYEHPIPPSACLAEFSIYNKFSLNGCTESFYRSGETWDQLDEESRIIHLQEHLCSWKEARSRFNTVYQISISYAGQILGRLLWSLFSRLMPQSISQFSCGQVPPLYRELLLPLWPDRPLASEVKPAIQNAADSYSHALEKERNLAGSSRKEVYEWLEANGTQEEYTLPSRDTWLRYIREAERAGVLRKPAVPCWSSRGRGRRPPKDD